VDDIDHVCDGITIQVAAMQMRADQIPDRLPASAENMVDDRRNVQHVERAVISGNISVMGTITWKRCGGDSK
jgi:hypothetical protein